jgi:hypothetical protein
MKALFFSTCFLLYSTCFSQSLKNPSCIHCSEGFYVKYMKDNSSNDSRDRFSKMPKDYVEISVLCYLNDTIDVWINGKNYINSLPIRTIDKMATSVIKGYKLTKSTLIQLRSKISNKCYEIVLDNRFKVVQIECFEPDFWILKYSNYFEYTENY